MHYCTSTGKIGCPIGGAINKGLANRRQENEAAHCKTKKKKSFYRLFTMFTLCTASVIELSVSTVPNSVLQRAAYHVENIRSNFDSTINSLNYTALL